jgi:hypothetical protein
MELVALYKRVVGLDVHQAQVTACALIEEADGTTRIEQRQFGAFKRDRRALAQWVASLRPDEVVMESTGMYWKSPYAALQALGIRAKVVNARHVKNVPGRKTDVADAHWLATLSRAGLLRGPFVPPAKKRQLRLIARQRQKLVSQLASEKNRLHKALTDGGIRLGVVVSDLHGQSARALVKAIIGRCSRERFGNAAWRTNSETSKPRFRPSAGARSRARRWPPIRPAAPSSANWPKRTSSPASRLSRCRSRIGDRAVLKVMYAALARAAETCKWVVISEFELKQLEDLRDHLNRRHAERTAPTVTSAYRSRISSRNGN